MVRFDDLLPPPTEEAAAAAIGVYGLSCSLAGFLLDTFLFGVSTTQVIKYCNNHLKDPLWIKVLAGAVAFMASLSTGYNWWIASDYFVKSFGKYTVFLDVTPLAWLALIDCVTISICQGFFAYRGFRLCNRNFLIPSLVGICILTSIGSTVAIGVIYNRLNSVLDSAKIVPPSVVWEAATMVGDAVITGSILYGLIKAKTGLAHTNRLIARIMRMTLEAQVAATAVSIILLVDTTVMPENLLGITILVFQSKVYVLGLFYSLNSRTSTSNVHTITMDTTHPMAFSEAQAATIHVDHETEMHVLNIQPPPFKRNRQGFGESKLDADNETKSQSSGTACSAPSSTPNKVSYVV